MSPVYAFENIDDTLPVIPVAARRVLDVTGRKLSLEGWRSLPVEQRRRVVQAGGAEAIEAALVALVDSATPAPILVPAVRDPDPASPPPALRAALGAQRPLHDAVWGALTALDRFVLCKYAARPDKLARAYHEIFGPQLSHLKATGEAHMVDVGAKAVTGRRATASARLRTTREVVDAMAVGRVPKGDVLAAARVAAILAAKRTAELIPLCHPVHTTHATVDFELDAAGGEVAVRAVVEAVDRTGVEMEALVAASVAALTIYDMIKGADRWARIEAVQLDTKSGGKSGDVARPPDRGGK